MGIQRFPPDMFFVLRVVQVGGRVRRARVCGAARRLNWLAGWLMAQPHHAQQRQQAAALTPVAAAAATLTHRPVPPLCPACPRQLLRGLATGMKVSGFSSAHQWAPYAREAERQLRGVPLPASITAHIAPLR